MEEDECDYGTPIGRVIRQITLLCKKPCFDNQLSEAIDVFHEKLNEQEKYLVNGIFKINFAESALFLQSCADLYGKKIDLLWNELLEFHTRLIRYDCEHHKEKGISINKDVVAKLEERRNRYLRKKNFKLLQDEVVVVPQKKIIEIVKRCATVIGENGGYFTPEEILILHRLEMKLFLQWKKVITRNRKFIKVPYMVIKHMRQQYKLKNDPIPAIMDHAVWDIDDGECNVMYGRVPTWRHLARLIEFNYKGMLPDCDNVIANINLDLNGRTMFLRSRKLPFDTPIDPDYRADYNEFCEQFLRKHERKWQNMPLDTFEDLHKQKMFLCIICRELERQGIYDMKIMYEIDDNCHLLGIDQDTLYELICDCVKGCMKTDLFVRLEKLPPELVESKLRQDSGYFEYNFDNDNKDVQTIETKEGLEAPVEESFSAVKENNDNGSDETDTDSKSDVNKDVNAVVTNKDENSETCEVPNCITSNEAADKDDNNFDVSSIFSDHDYCVTPLPMITLSKDNSALVKVEQDLDKTVEDVFKKPHAVPETSPKVLKNKEPRKKRPTNKELECDTSPTKRRKLSQKQLKTLLKSKITPVKLLKFEKFFSENYQPEDGEGKVPSVEYDSEDSDTENIDSENTDMNLADNTNNRSENDIASIISDHSYCQPMPESSRNDSGFFELPKCEDARRCIEKLRDIGIDYAEIAREEAIKKEKQQREKLEKQSIPYVPNESELQDILKQESKARVEDWRNTITPILINLKEKDFDIHEYGSQIIEGMELNDSKPFKNIVQGKTSAEVVRYFISSLQLANTSNIEICGVKQGQLSNDTFNVKLLSKDRYHEHLNEYMAPSVGDLAEKLEKVRAMNSEENNVVKSTVKQAKPVDTDTASKNKNVLHDNFKKKITVKLTKLTNINLPQRESREPTDNTYQHNKENRNIETPVFSDNTVKGKSIMKRQTTPPKILNYDLSLPSTSRHIHWADGPSRSSFYDSQMPSTSSQVMSTSHNSELFDVNQRCSPKSYRASPNKRRGSDSTEDSFVQQLVTTQRMNPDIQLHSTPHGPTPSKLVKVNAPSKKSILF